MVLWVVPFNKVNLVRALQGCQLRQCLLILDKQSQFLGAGNWQSEQVVSGSWSAQRVVGKRREKGQIVGTNLYTESYVTPLVLSVSPMDADPLLSSPSSSGHLN